MKRPCAQKHAATWTGLPPRAPRSPISRVLRTTEMRSELVTEKAATITMKRSRKKIMFRSRLSTQRNSEKLSCHENARMSVGQDGVDPRRRVVLVHARASGGRRSRGRSTPARRGPGRAAASRRPCCCRAAGGRSRGCPTTRTCLGRNTSSAPELVDDERRVDLDRVAHAGPDARGKLRAQDDRVVVEVVERADAARTGRAGDALDAVEVDAAEHREGGLVAELDHHGVAGRRGWPPRRRGPTPRLRHERG